MWIGQSTNENIRAIFDSTANPFDAGFRQNYSNMCCASLPPSRLPNMHDIITEDELLQNLGPTFAASVARAEAVEQSADSSRATTPPLGLRQAVANSAAKVLSPLTQRFTASFSPPNIGIAQTTPTRPPSTATPLLSDQKDALSYNR